MKILHVVPSFGFGGMEKIICSVINSDVDGHDHVILTLDGTSTAREWISNSRTTIVPYRKEKLRRRFFLSLFNLLRGLRPELLMSYNWGATDAIWLGRLAGISNIVQHEHGFNADEGVSTVWTRDAIRFMLYRLVSKVVVVSHELEEILEQRFRVSQPSCIRIPNGIDTSLYAPDENDRKRTRKSLGYQDSDLVIGFSGRLDPVKNLDLLLDIFQGSNPQDYPFRLLIVGDGSERSRLEARCKAEGLHPYVIFAGEQREVRSYLRAMDVFLLTSLREQMPLTVLEAMAVGVPAIATRVGEIPYIIDDGADGFVRDLKAPVEAFVQPLRILSCSFQRRKMREAARKKVLAHFQQEPMVQNYLKVIREFA
jgi:glycosyltransferase involved in cell wall biosynthesis